jgi:hypothetical protein
MATLGLRPARSATRHRVRRAQSRYVIEHAGIRYRIPPPAQESDDRLLYLGDDPDGTAFEVMAIELEFGQLLVIHAMPIRERFVPQYEEAKRWRV